MDPTIYTPCYSDCDINDIDNKTFKCHNDQLATEYSYSRQLPTFAYISPACSSRMLESPPSSTDNASDAIHSREPFSWGDYHQQCAQPIYFNDDQEISIASSPGHVLIAPLQKSNDDDDTKNLPHARAEINYFEVNNGRGDPETDQTCLPTTIMDATIGIPPLQSIWNKKDLEYFLFHDLSMIMNTSVCQDDIYLSSPTCQSISSPCSPPPSVAIDHIDRDRSYICDSCHKKFTRPQDCTRHIKSTHIKIKDFICYQTGCKKGFVRSDTFKRHLRNIHHISNK